MLGMRGFRVSLITLSIVALLCPWLCVEPLALLGDALYFSSFPRFSVGSSSSCRQIVEP
ncbi:hypothetical protein EXIGLDRAFT_132955 [Exidia glandulosa HHB12029]|uniref:Uncharacterized protein n=1 Tax=Exidia glandulosa HHB12029 TaxID=1314781 RepID=A0A165NET9_EXIGL|nr:hypothetical protein EXIGLDRAFT_132955 [Exidia glandulosa HHB12029]